MARRTCDAFCVEGLTVPSPVRRLPAGQRSTGAWASGSVAVALLHGMFIHSRQQSRANPAPEFEMARPDLCCEGLPCWRFVHAGGTSHFDGAQHKASRYAYFARCSQCGTAVGPQGAPAQRVAAHVMGYPCAPCNCCCARLTLKTTCKECNDRARGSPGCFDFFDHRFSFIAAAPRDADGDRVILNVPKDSGSPEGWCGGYVCQPACFMRDYRWADPAPRWPRAAGGGVKPAGGNRLGGTSSKATPRNGGAMFTLRPGPAGPVLPAAKIEIMVRP